MSIPSTEPGRDARVVEPARQQLESGRYRKGTIMSLGDKAKHSAEELAAKVKQGVGKATDNEELEAEGHVEEKKADLKQVGDELKDAGERTKDVFTDKD